MGSTPNDWPGLFIGRRRWLVLGLAVAAAGIATAAVVTSKAPMVTTTIPAGTRLMGALGQTVSTKENSVGQHVTLRTVEPLQLAGATVPEGIIIRGEVTHSKGGGRIAGAPELTIRFSNLEVDGRSYPISAEPFRVKGKSDATESVAEIAGGAVVGAIVGAVAGSAVKGAVVGAAAGTGVALITKGNQIVLPAGLKLRMRLSEPVSVAYQPEAPKSAGEDKP